MEHRTHESELARFSESMLSGQMKVASLGPREHQVTWEVGDRAGSSRTIGLHSGITLSLSRVRWERSWTLVFDPDPSTLKFIVARGPGPRVTTRNGATHELVGGTATVSRFHRSTELRFEFADATSSEEHE